MNLRKLISFGKNSYIISLPKEWVDRNKLKKGDLIALDENKEGLLLTLNSKAETPEENRIVIQSESKSMDMLKTEIVSAYLDNYNVIEVISKELKTNSAAIKKMLNDLAGFEIIDQSSGRIVAKDLINVNEISIITLIRRMDNITRAMIEDIIPCFDGAKGEEDIIHRDEEVNRLHFLAERVIRSGLKDIRIAKSLDADPLKLHSQHTVSVYVEKVADNIKSICGNVYNLKMDEKVRNELKTVFLKIREAYKEVMKAFYTNDSKLALSIELKNKQLIEECDNFLDNHKHKGLDYSNLADKKGICRYRPSCASCAKVIEDMKGMASSIKYIARTMIGGG